MEQVITTTHTRHVPDGATEHTYKTKTHATMGDAMSAMVTEAAPLVGKGFTVTAMSPQYLAVTNEAGQTHAWTVGVKE